MFVWSAKKEKCFFLGVHRNPRVDKNKSFLSKGPWIKRLGLEQMNYFCKGVRGPTELFEGTQHEKKKIMNYLEKKKKGIKLDCFCSGAQQRLAVINNTLKKSEHILNENLRQ